MEIPPEKRQAIIDAIRAGRKIDAIKLFREGTDFGLAESKAAVEKLSQELSAREPEKFSAPPSGKGCLILSLTGMLAAAALAFLVSITF